LSRRYGVDLGRRVHLDDVELLEGLSRRVCPANHAEAWSSAKSPAFSSIRT